MSLVALRFAKVSRCSLHVVWNLNSSCMKKPFFISFLRRSKVTCHRNHFKTFYNQNVSIPNSQIRIGFALNLAIFSFYVWAPNIRYIHLPQKRQGWDIVSNLFGIYSWYMGLLVFWRTGGQGKCLFLVYVYTLYMRYWYTAFIWIGIRLVCGWYTLVYGAFPF